MLFKGATAGLVALLSVLAPLSSATPAAKKGNFTYNDRQFLLNGEPFQIIGGQMDPQRIPKEYWRQRLQMAAAMGLNTIFSYIFWNNMEPRPGEWTFKGRNDVAQFFRIAQEEGLHVVLRPGPYICGEHEWGGFPAWLSQIPGMQVRQNNGPFLSATKSYLDRLGSELRRLQVTNGGPILMTQLENEYGSFDKDKKYLQAMADMLRANFDLSLYTNDGGGKDYLDGGSLHGVLAQTDGDPKTGFAARDKYVTDPTCLGPLLDGEYYITWIDDWSSNSAHHITSGNEDAMDAAVSDLEWILQGNNSFSIYMFHGGTNWGFENGGIWASDRTMAVTSSYDYGAPLDESGRPTELYHRLRDMISKYVPAGSIPDVPQVPALAEIQEFALHPALALFDTRSAQPDKQSAQPVTMESLGQSYGFILYEHKVAEGASGVLAPGDGPRDRVIVYVNGAKVGVIDRTYVTPGSVHVSLEQGDLVQLLVENVGRIDYSYKLKEQQKGIVGSVTVGQDKVLEGWSTYSLPLSTLPSGLSGGHQINPKDNGSPVFYTGSFKLPSGTKSDLGGDTFLALPKGIKGQVWVNGINLGRYWTVGPQQSLYVPGCYIKDHGYANDIVVLELEPKADTQLTGKGIATREWGNSPDPDAP